MHVEKLLLKAVLKHDGMVHIFRLSVQPHKIVFFSPRRGADILTACTLPQHVHLPTRNNKFSNINDLIYLRSSVQY